MKVILQSESHECGLACLAIVASQYGLYFDLTTLRRRFSISTKGTSLQQIVHYSQALGFSSRPLRLELDELKQLRLPCILHWNLNHFVVLEKTRSNKIIIIDPAVGRRTLSINEVSRCFTGIALELTPNATFKSVEKKPRLRLRELTGKILGLKSALAKILILALALEVVALLSPQVTQWVVDHALVSADYNLLLLVIIGGCLLLTIDFLLRMAQGWMNLRLNQQLTLQWTSNFFQHLLRLPWSYFEKRHLGDITARFHSLEAIRSVLAKGAITILLDASVAVITLILMLLYSRVLTAIVITAVALYLFLRWAFYAPLRNATEERIVLATRENAYFLETIRAVQPLKLFNSTSLRLSTWQNLLIDVQNRDIKTQKLLLTFSGINTLIFGLENLLLLYFGGLSVLGNTFTLGMLLAFLAYKSQFTSRTSKLIDLGVEIKMLSLHGERLADIALEEPEQKNLIETDLSRIDPCIEFKDVSFRYGDGERWVFKGLSLKIEAGDAVALVGRSGCGKSTLFKLMLGLLEPTEGTIRIGGIDIRQLGPHAIRSMVGVVMQDDQLMAGSLAENIACFEPGAVQEKIEAAAKQANIHKTILNMPMGYQTLISEMGSGLSGGQKQRLLLARALYKKPKILALDEATSHLDLHGEQHIAINLRSDSMTRVVIAHRRETVTMVFRVIYLEQGIIMEDIRLDKNDTI